MVRTCADRRGAGASGKPGSCFEVARLGNGGRALGAGLCARARAGRSASRGSPVAEPGRGCHHGTQRVGRTLGGVAAAVGLSSRRAGTPLTSGCRSRAVRTRAPETRRRRLESEARRLQDNVSMAVRAPRAARTRSKLLDQRHVGPGQGTREPGRGFEPAPGVLRPRNADPAPPPCSASGRGRGHGSVRCRCHRDLARTGDGAARRGATRGGRSDCFLFIERFTSFARLKPTRLHHRSAVGRRFAAVDGGPGHAELA